uniref:Uncharacterized protein n=1 Tax=Anguilla anguilla TaxID=7936 RepID=A0A0E9WNF6_ANGAN
MDSSKTKEHFSPFFSLMWSYQIYNPTLLLLSVILYLVVYIEESNVDNFKKDMYVKEIN